MASNPLSQFETHVVVPLPEIMGMDLSITNVTIFTLAAAAGVVALLGMASSKASMVPNRLQSVGELAYEFIAGMIRDIIGPEGMRFFPYVFTLFLFILICNLLGMIPVFFTVTSQLSVTFALAVMTILLVVGVGLSRHGLGFFKMFAPSGIPIALMPLLIPIEIISFLSRPITLAFRLFANMLAGHILLKLFGGFIISLAALGGAGLIGAILPFFGLFAITGLEFLVAFLQAYVFAILTVIYLNDVVHMHH